jgi:3-isopropylmalate dehydrogenase
MTPAVKLAVIPGDGIGPEVIGEALTVLDAVRFVPLRRGTR